MHHEHKRISLKSTHTFKITIHTNYALPTQQTQYLMMLALSYTSCISNTIDTATMKFLQSPKNTRRPLFSGLTNIHKPNCPLQPTASRCDCQTGRLSSYIICFIQPLANNIPPHIKETKRLLDLIDNHPPLPTNALLVTVDISTLYTNI